MKKFAKIYEKITISLCDDTLTFYPKSISQEDEFEHFVEVIDFDKLGIQGVLTEDNSNHWRYHKDGINQLELHWHLHYKATITSDILTQTVKELILFNVISQSEGDDLCGIFHNMVKSTPPERHFLEIILNPPLPNVTWNFR